MENWMLNINQISIIFEYILAQMSKIEVSKSQFWWVVPWKLRVPAVGSPLTGKVGLLLWLIICGSQ